MAINRHKTSQPSSGDALEAAISIAEERNGYISKMKEALESRDDNQLKFYARKLCGIPEAESKGVASAKKKPRS